MWVCVCVRVRVRSRPCMCVCNPSKPHPLSMGGALSLALPSARPLSAGSHARDLCRLPYLFSALLLLPICVAVIFLPCSVAHAHAYAPPACVRALYVPLSSPTLCVWSLHSPSTFIITCDPCQHVCLGHTNLRVCSPHCSNPGPGPPNWGDPSR